MRGYRARRLQELKPYVDAARAMCGGRSACTLSASGQKRRGAMKSSRELLSGPGSVLDMGTGGGELFAEICEGYGGSRRRDGGRGRPTFPWRQGDYRLWAWLWYTHRACNSRSQTNASTSF